MKILLIFTFAFLIFSLIFDIKKTLSGIKRRILMFLKIFSSFLNVIILISIFLTLIPYEKVVKLLGKYSGFLGIAIASVLGSISLIPGFIAYPLANILIKYGVSYRIIAVFITTLLMVGILTLPVEIKFFGVKVSFLRNFLSFIGAIIVGVFL